MQHGTWQQGDIIDVTIDQLSNRGDGVGRWHDPSSENDSNRVVFIPDAVPGDRLQTRLIRVKPSFAHGKLLEILEPSPHRVKPNCIVADKCGGCQWQAVSYDRQLTAKHHEVCQSLERIGGFEASLVQSVIPSDPLNYRNKVTYPLGRSKTTEQVQAGYYQKGSHKLVNLNQCPVQDERFNRFLANIKEDIHIRSWTIYDEKLHKRSLRHLALRIGRRTGEILLTLISRDQRLKGLEEQAEQWMELYPDLVGVCLNVNYKRTNAIYGDQTFVIAGRGYIKETFADVSLNVHATTFFQVNTEQAERLLKLIQETLALTGTEKIVDAYCGIGTLTLPLANQADQVIGIESHSDSIAQALENAALNDINNVGFYEGKVEKLLPRLSELAPGVGIPDVVVLDPPRKGCDGTVLETLRSLQPPRIVYISCNPATLARDLHVLCNAVIDPLKGKQGHYRVESVHPFDFFPQTAHVESVAFLSLVSG